MLPADPGFLHILYETANNYIAPREALLEALLALKLRQQEVFSEATKDPKTVLEVARCLERGGSMEPLVIEVAPAGFTLPTHPDINNEEALNQRLTEARTKHALKGFESLIEKERSLHRSDYLLMPTATALDPYIDVTTLGEEAQETANAKSEIQKVSLEQEARLGRLFKVDATENDWIEAREAILSWFKARKVEIETYAIHFLTPLKTFRDSVRRALERLENAKQNSPGASGSASATTSETELGNAQATPNGVASLVQTEAIKWSKPDSPTQWAKVFEVSYSTMIDWLKTQIVRNRRLSPRRYQIAVDELPVAAERC